VSVFPDPAGVYQAAAERFLESAHEAVRRSGRFAVALSGGSTPRELYRLLAEPPYRETVPWSRTYVFFGDERCVPPDDPRSNYRMAMETLLGRVPVPGGQIFRITGEAKDPARAAAAYEAELRGMFAKEGSPRFDLVLLGIGPDGHTASLFPGSPLLEETSRWVAADFVPKLGSWRITLTLPALNAARRILFLIAGQDKARVFSEAIGGRPHPGPYPCELVAPADGTVEVLADRLAAGN
jgi:6-phosphogluconolactonase